MRTVEKFVLENAVLKRSTPACKVIAPPGGVCANAFETRLPTALCNKVRSRSAMTGPSVSVVVSVTPLSAADAS